MGIDIGAAHWSYTGFNRFRERLAEADQIFLNGMEGFVENGMTWEGIKSPLVPLLFHSDCDGELTPKECQKVVPRLREIISTWPDVDYDRINGELLATAMEQSVASHRPLRFS